MRARFFLSDRDQIDELLYRIGMRSAQTLQPPCGVLIERLVSIQPIEQGFSLAKKIAQDTIDESAKSSACQLPGCFNRLIDNGMRRFGSGFKTIERTQEQCPNFWHRQRPTE